MKNIYKILLIIIVPLIVFSGCEDEAPMDYVKMNFVEAYLTVDEPIKEVKIFRSMPLAESYVYEDSFIKDAIVKIISDSDTLDLEWDYENNNGYRYSDTSYKIQEDRDYNLFAVLDDGTEITGTTHTPVRFEWVKAPDDEIYFPKDTLDLPAVDSLIISWTEVPKVNFYILSVKCIDTLNYGMYLDPPTQEMNRRTYSIMKDNDDYYREITSWNFIGNTETPTVWMAFKWFGLQDVSVYAPDSNMLQWFLQSWTQTYDPNLSSVQGAEGVFGSCSKIKKEFFMYKNQP